MGTFATRLRDSMVARDVKQHEVAVVAGVSDSAVNQWLNMGRVPAPFRVKKVANFLETTPEFLLYGEGDGPMNAYEARLLHIARKMSDGLRDRFEHFGRIMLAEEEVKMPAELRESDATKVPGLPANDSPPVAKRRKK